MKLMLAQTERQSLPSHWVSSTRPIMCLIATIVLACGSLKPATADHFDCYLLAGQSNMDGRGLNSDLTETQQQAVKDAIIFYSNPPLATTNWEPLKPGYSRPPKFKDQLPSPKFGPEIGFVTEMQQTRPNQKIAIIKATRGGTNLRSDWQPGTPTDSQSQGRCYQNLIQTINTATEKLVSDGHTYTIRAMLWHQGESDANADPKTHQQRLTNLIARVRSDCSSPELPVILGQVADNGKRDKVRTAIQATAADVDHVGFVAVEGLTTWDEGTHFDAASQLLLGQRFASETIQMLSSEKPATTKIVCFGDSITKRGYPKLLGEQLKAQNFTAQSINAGVGGHTTRQGLHRMKKDVQHHHPDVVVILFGTNDMRVDSEKHVPIAEYQKNLTEMVNACRKIGSKVILCTVPPINDEPYFSRHDLKVFQASGGLQALVKGYCEAAMKVSEQTHVPLVDLQTLLKATPAWMHADGVHPTDTGNRIIAQHIANAVGKALEADQ